MNAPASINTARSERAPGLFLPLADFACGLDLAQVPRDVLEQARLGVLDTIGCIIAGANRPAARMISHCERRALAGPVARVFASAERFPVEVAARLNAYFGEVGEHGDATGGHTSIAALPAALAVADQVRASGAELLRAYIAATEIATRLLNAYHAWKRPDTDVGIGPGIISTIGAAAGCALLQRQSHAHVLEAMAIGGGLAGWGPVGVGQDEGATVKPLLHGAWPAGIAVLAARYAQGGMTGPVKLLESPMGLFSSLATQFDERAIIYPDDWHVPSPMTAGSVQGRFRANVSGVLGSGEADAYIALTERLEALENCEALYAPFGPAA